MTALAACLALLVAGGGQLSVDLGLSGSGGRRRIEFSSLYFVLCFCLALKISCRANYKELSTKNKEQRP